jgi:hypothetical protein
MLIVLPRREPRRKSNYDRTSARHYTSFDTNSGYDNQQEATTTFNNKQDIYRNNLDLTDSTLRQYNDMIISSNGQDESTVSFGGDIDDDDDSDEYAYFILHYLFFFFRSLASFFILLVQY